MKLPSPFLHLESVLYLDFPTFGFLLAYSQRCFLTVLVVIRQTILQLKTPDHMRGRVSAVNSMFVGSSNELGAFESGLLQN
jgi:hypothetical protein